MSEAGLVSVAGEATGSWGRCRVGFRAGARRLITVATGGGCPVEDRLPFSGSGEQGLILVAVVEENEIFRRGLVACLESDPRLRVAYQARSGPLPVPVDVIIASRRAVARLTGTAPVLVCSDARSPAARVGAVAVVAVLPRDRLTEDQIVAAVRAAASGLRVRAESGEPTIAPGGVSERSIEILRLLAAGCDTREISESIGYSERTVKTAIQDAAHRLGARTRAQVVSEAIRLGLI